MESRESDGGTGSVLSCAAASVAEGEAGHSAAQWRYKDKRKNVTVAASSAEQGALWAPPCQPLVAVENNDRLATNSDSE